MKEEKGGGGLPTSNEGGGRIEIVADAVELMYAIQAVPNPIEETNTKVKKMCRLAWGHFVLKGIFVNV